jgi:hypothetical protein
VASGGHVTIGSVVTDFAIGMLEGGIFIGAQSNIIKLFDRFKSITKISGLTRAHAKNIDKINEIFHNVTVRRSLSGDILDSGHIEKLYNHRRGLIRAVNGLKGSLNNPKLSWRVRRLLKKKISLGESMIRRIDELLGN